MFENIVKHVQRVENLDKGCCTLVGVRDLPLRDMISLGAWRMGLGCSGKILPSPPPSSPPPPPPPSPTWGWGGGATYYLLPTTYYLLLTTYYLRPTTYHEYSRDCPLI